MEKRYTVFVSSTFKDLIDARWAVARGLMRLNLIPLGMENFTASDKSQWEVIKKTIDLSDYYVLILGNCYGSIDPETGISYTEKEYRYALEREIPCLTFISKDVPLKPEHLEPEKSRKKLEAFRADAMKGRVVDFWTNPDMLMAQVTSAIALAQGDSPRPGWVRYENEKPNILGAEESVARDSNLGRPFVAVYSRAFVENNHDIFIFVENVGDSVARNVRLNITTGEDFNPYGIPLRDWRPISEGVSVLKPNERLWSLLLDTSTREGQENKDKEIIIEATYQDIEGREYKSEGFKLDLMPFSGTLWKTSKHERNGVLISEKIVKPEGI